jgi:hypothetical protein
MWCLISAPIVVHKESMSKHKEERSRNEFGFDRKDETVTWRGKAPFFKTRLMRSKITAMKKPDMFTDEQVQGDFKAMKHEHHFKPCENGTIVIDLFHFESPYGILGEWFNSLYLTNYMKRLLEQRNKTIKEFAETEKWKRLLIK